MRNIAIKATIERVPGGMMMLPLLCGALICTFAPQFPKQFGSFTGALFTGAMPLMAMFFVCVGASIELRSITKVIKKGGALFGTKVSVAVLLGVVLGQLWGEQPVTVGLLSGMSVLAVVAAMNDTNGGLYMALMQQYGESEDVSAFSIMSLESGPFLTMVTLGIAGLSSFPWQALLGSVLPLLVGMAIGNLDRDMRRFLISAIPVLVPFFAFALGAGIDLKVVWKAGLLGVLLGFFVLCVGGFFLYWADRLTGGTGVAGVAAASTAGNAAAVPAIVAAANPVYAEAAKSATLLVAACVVVTAVGVPLVTAWTARRAEQREPGRAARKRAAAAAASNDFAREPGGLPLAH